MAPKIGKFSEDLLIALAETATGGQIGHMDPHDVAKRKRLDFVSGWVDEAVSTLKKQKFLVVSYSARRGPDSGIHVTVTGDGMEEAERIMAEREAIPAADRTVTIDHNAPA